ncbi:hypothetical protein [Enterococcus faecalis]|uniref:hypothetical protein n=1 Tax=Enterococcus faecalis TaxID=1351 RepID=UPI0035E8EDB2
MESELLSAIVGGVIGVVGTIITQRGAKIVKESELRQTEKQAKRGILTEVYKSLISVVDLYPEESPNDILEHIQYSPNYSLESYDAIFNILDIKLEDYKEQLKIVNIDYQRRADIEVEISNINYAKDKLEMNRDSYYKAVKEYASFLDSEKTVFELYASQSVKNCLVRFEVIIHNVFISGYSAMIPDNQNENIIKMRRRELIQAMRDDIGIV